MNNLFLAYRADSSYNTAGYLGNLTPIQQDTLEELKDWISDKFAGLKECMSLLSYDTSEIGIDLLLLRYLRSKNFSLKKVKVMIEENIKVNNIYVIFSIHNIL